MQFQVLPINSKMKMSLLTWVMTFKKTKSTNRGSQREIKHRFPRRKNTHIHKYTFSHTRTDTHNHILICQVGITYTYL